MPCYGHSWMKIPILNQVLMNPEGMDWFRFQGQWKEPGPLADHKCSSPFRLASLADRKYFSKLRLASLANFVCASKTFFLANRSDPSNDYGGADAEKTQAEIQTQLHPRATDVTRCSKAIGLLSEEFRREDPSRIFDISLVFH